MVFTLRATVAADARGPLSNTAQVLLPIGIPDTSLANNTATDVDTIQANHKLYLPLVRR